MSPPQLHGTEHIHGGVNLAVGDLQASAASAPASRPTSEHYTVDSKTARRNALLA